MNAMAPTRPTSTTSHQRRVQLPAGPAAAAEARSLLTTAIRGWHVPVDADIALLLTSELVTNALKHGGGAIMIGITCSLARLRVDVHDTSTCLPAPSPGDAPADAETGRGLLLVDSLSAEWGFYRTPAGKAVYFTLAFPPESPLGRVNGL